MSSAWSLTTTSDNMLARTLLETVGLRPPFISLPYNALYVIENMLITWLLISICSTGESLWKPFGITINTMCQAIKNYTLTLCVLSVCFCTHCTINGLSSWKNYGNSVRYPKYRSSSGQRSSKFGRSQPGIMFLALLASMNTFEHGFIPPWSRTRNEQYKTSVPDTKEARGNNPSLNPHNLPINPIRGDAQGVTPNIVCSTWREAN